MLLSPYWRKLALAGLQTADTVALDSTCVGFAHAGFVFPLAAGLLAVLRPVDAGRIVENVFCNLQPCGGMPLDMTVHEIRARLAAGKATVGTWLQLPSPDVAELMARAGYDWVAVDGTRLFWPHRAAGCFRAIERGSLSRALAKPAKPSRPRWKPGLRGLSSP